jgi:hypothetical protein
MADTLRNYTFLPWLRQGLAGNVEVTDNLGGASVEPQRASVDVSFTVGTEPVSKQAHLLGPGDVVGINPRAIVKTEPRNWVTDFEANYLPYIEFYEEEFPWRFTPAKAAGDVDQSKLRPWIFLIVLTEDEFDEKSTGGPLDAFEIKPSIDPGPLFPKKDQTWAWAHVHVNQNVIGDTLLQTTTPDQVRNVEQQLSSVLGVNSDSASSRLLCPRKLKENTAYHAFVIPSFETGRLAGLGLDLPAGISGQKTAWDDGQRLHPIYYRWFFRTGTKGDFEFLVDLLEPRPVDKRVGVREMDMQQPEYEVDGMLPPLDMMGLEGALKSPQMESFPADWPPPTDFLNPPAGSAGRFLNDLAAKVNLQFNLQQEPGSGNDHPDPIVSPPLYGKWYAKAETLDVQNGTGWVNELNRDPRYRTPAGFGTQVIQNNQESLMQQAWSQLGDLLRTNQKIRQLQLGLMSNFVMYQKNVLPQTSGQLLTFTQPVQARVLGSPVTIARQVQESRLPQAALDPAFRKITRNRGTIMRKATPEGQGRRPNVVSLLNDGVLTAAPKAPEPTGQVSIDKMAETITPPDLPEWLRQWLHDKTARWILIGVLAFALALLFVTGAVIVFAALAAILVVLLVAEERLRARVETAEAFRERSFTPRFVDTIPPRPAFVLTEFNQPMPAVAGGGNLDSGEAANFRLALKDAYNVHQSQPPAPPPRKPVNMSTTVVKLRQALNPSIAIPKRAEFVLKIPAKIKDAYLLPQPTLVTVMAHPVFTQPMYRPLLDISSELLVPNLDLIPNNTISLMKTNQRFIEAYMVGLNHEMGCELLWREFPTDQRGSYFRQFWDVADVVNRDPSKTPAQIEEELLDITKLHTWDETTNLGAHLNRPLPAGGDADESRLVLVVRGDLLKKYPTVVIYAQRAKWTKDEQGRDIRELDTGDPTQTIKNPIFKAEINPDIRFLGFDLTQAVAKGNPDPQAADPGWFFVLQERPGEPRFGLDNLSDDSPETPTNWNEVAWEHLSNFDTLDVIDLSLNAPLAGAMTDPPDNQFVWGKNAADMAYILYQVPVMVAFHAADMLA